MKFDPKKFESLAIFELSKYTVELIREPVEEADFFPYFLSKAATMDASHLEFALAILGKIEGETASHKVAEYLVHPDYSVRYIATKIVMRMTDIDEQVMGYVVKSMKMFANERMSFAKELKVVLNRPASDKARQIALEYVSNFGDGVA